MPKKRSKKYLVKYAKPITYVLAFIVVGGLLIIAHASNPTASVEPENGTSNAIVGNDTNASNGQYVQFSTSPRVAPDTLSIIGQKMLNVKTGLSSTQYNSNYTNVLRIADSYLDNTPHSVMDKTQVPPSGSKHDFMSQGPYLWPDPNSPDGLPYIYIDGKINPEFYDITDTSYWNDFVRGSSALATAYYFSGQAKYATKAEQMINAWFIADATKMNPNMNYAAFWPGKTTGSGAGIIRLNTIYRIVDDVKILQLSPAWTANDQSSFNSWCTSYLDWVLNSSAGISESKTTNNHVTWYEAQVASIAEFLGNHTAAAQALNKTKTLIENQIEADGTMPLELERTRPWNYSTLNMTGFTTLAALGLNEGIDLWSYTAPSGGSVRKALDYLAPYANGSRVWKDDHPNELDTTWAPQDMTIPLRQAASAYNNPAYSTDADQSLGTTAAGDYSRLLY